MSDIQPIRLKNVRQARICRSIQECIMINRLIARLETRRSTKFLLDRSDDRLLADIGLTRADLEAMHLGLGPAEAQQKAASFSGLSLRRVIPA
jgi:uncharacterized protein YjiS (DUF1127 family)